MELTLTVGCWIKFCMWLTKVMYLYNYYIPFYHPSVKQVQQLTLSAAQAVPPYSRPLKYTKLNKTALTVILNSSRRKWKKWYWNIHWNISHGPNWCMKLHCYIKNLLIEKAYGFTIFSHSRCNKKYIPKFNTMLWLCKYTKIFLLHRYGRGILVSVLQANICERLSEQFENLAEEWDCCFMRSLCSISSCACLLCSSSNCCCNVCSAE
jgi:hypothetical protein